MTPTPSDGWRFWIDRGGTFTDIVARRPDGRLEALKLSMKSDGFHALCKARFWFFRIPNY